MLKRKEISVQHYSTSKQYLKKHYLGPLFGPCEVVCLRCYPMWRTWSGGSGGGGGRGRGEVTGQDSPRCPTVGTPRVLSHTYQHFRTPFLLSLYHHHPTSSSFSGYVSFITSVVPLCIGQNSFRQQAHPMRPFCNSAGNHWRRLSQFPPSIPNGLPICHQMVPIWPYQVVHLGFPAARIR
jgi:hypothetical protein